MHTTPAVPRRKAAVDVKTFRIAVDDKHPFRCDALQFRERRLGICGRGVPSEERGKIDFRH